MKSMTGFGKTETIFKEKKMVVEVKTLNSKQFELNCRLPQIFRSKELEIRTLFLEQLERGKVDLLLYVESKQPNQTSEKLNAEVLINYCKELNALQQNLSMPNSLQLLEMALTLPNSIQNFSEDLQDEDWAFLQNILKETLVQVNEFRLQEGLILKKDFEKRIGFIKSALEKVEILDIDRKINTRKRLEEAFAGQKIENFDQNRFEQELIYYFEKLDITEEKVRLKKHLSYFEEALDIANESNGKKLNFIAQEIGREINTIGSKANNAEMQRLVVDMKDELEKIKEQLGNIL